MALLQLLRAIRRHLVLVGLGMIITLATLVLVHRQPGLYQTQIGVVVRPPEAYINKNPYWGRDYSLIATAGVLAKMAGPSSGGARTASSAVTLAGLGVRDGYAINLPNRGGQWAYDYDRPILDVQAVGRTPDEARTNLNQAVTAVRVSLAQLQDDRGIRRTGLLTLELDPENPLVGYARGRPSRALAATLILGAGGTLTAVLLADDPRNRHRAALITGWLRSRMTRRQLTA